MDPDTKPLIPCLVLRCNDYFCKTRNQQIIAREVKPDCTVYAGEAIGPFTISIEDQSRDITPSFSSKSVQMTIRRNDEVIFTSSSEFSTDKQFWFKEFEGLVKSGPYSISFSIVNCDVVLDLEIPFCVSPHFDIEYVETPAPTECHRIGEPFNIILTFKDKFDNPVKEVKEEFRSAISSPGLDFDVSNTITEGGEVHMLGVIAAGKIEVLSNGTLPLVMIEADITLWTADSTKDSGFSVKIQLKFKAGIPEAISVVTPAEGETYIVENGTLPQIGVRVVDAFGNAVTTAIEPKIAVQVTFGEYMVTGGRKDLPGEYSLSFMTGPNGSPCPLKGGSTLKFDMDDVSEKKLFAKIFMNNFPNVKPVYRDIIIKKCAKPSDIRIFCSSEFDPDTICEIRNGDTLDWTAAQMIRNITFKMMDESNSMIEKPNLTSNFRVSWLNADWVNADARNLKSINSGRLPDIRAPKNDGEAASFNVTFYEASTGPTVKSLCSKTNESAISFQFNIRGIVGPPAYLHASFYSGGENRIRSSETMDNWIVLTVEDLCHNKITDISDEDIQNMSLTTSKGTLDHSTIVKEKGIKPGDLYIKGLKITFDENIRSLDLEIKFMTLTTSLKLEVMAGLPEKLDWIFPKEAYDEQGRITAMNRQTTGPWSVQVKDRFMNPTKFSGIVVSVGITKTVEVKDAVQKPITNSEGIASFGKVRIVDKKIKPPTPDCRQCHPALCYGTIGAKARIDFNGLAILTSPIKIHFKCDPFRVNDFIVNCDEISGDNFVNDFTAGSKYPHFTVSLLAENGTLIKDLELLSRVLMINMKAESAPSPTYLSPNVVEENGKIAFEDLLVPFEAGKYSMNFFYQHSDGEEVSSRNYFYKVLPAVPCFFIPEKNPIDRYVSNTSDRNKRMIVHSLKFVLQDEYHNIISGEDDTHEGTLNVLLESAGDTSVDLPQLEDSCKTSFPIVAGRSISDPFFLKEQTSGENGTAYHLIFRAEFPKLKAEIHEFKVPFYFVDDNAKHEQLNLLISRKKSLNEKKRILFMEYSQMDNEYQHLQHNLKVFSDRLSCRLTELNNPNIGVRIKIKEGSRFEFDSLVRDADNALKLLNATTFNDPNTRRVAPTPDEPGVLGKIIHLGRVSDEKDIDIVSWLMASDIKCIVTETTTKALEILKSDKKQQVLALDTIRHVDWNEKMPHETVKNEFQVAGNPVLARNLFYFPNYEEKCRLAFGSLLADAIIIDSLDDAIHYRKYLIDDKQRCPMIVTRSGEKITASGKLIAASSITPSDPKMLRFHRIPIGEINDGKKRLEILQDLLELADAKEQAFTKLQEFEESQGLRLKHLRENLSAVDAELKDIEQSETGISRKRRAPEFDKAFKRFC